MQRGMKENFRQTCSLHMKALLVVTGATLVVTMFLFFFFFQPLLLAWHLLLLAWHLFLIANIVTTSEAPVTTSKAPVTTSVAPVKQHTKGTRDDKAACSTLAVPLKGEMLRWEQSNGHGTGTAKHHTKSLV